MKSHLLLSIDLERLFKGARARDLTVICGLLFEHRHKGRSALTLAKGLQPEEKAVIASTRGKDKVAPLAVVQQSDLLRRVDPKR